jgi:hypothetical protein
MSNTTKIECPTCEGSGEVYFSCCGHNMKGHDLEDYGICPGCKEHLGGPETCEDCNGSGEVQEREEDYQIALHEAKYELPR